LPKPANGNREPHVSRRVRNLAPGDNAAPGPAIGNRQTSSSLPMPSAPSTHQPAPCLLRRMVWCVRLTCWSHAL
jgi:hypothetical protein